MRKFAALAALTIIALLPLQVKGQTTPPALKVGYVDVRKVVMESDRGKEIGKTLQDEAEKKKKELSQKQDDLQKMKDAIEKQSATITPEARNEKEKQYQSRLKDFQRIVSDYESDMQQKNQELTQAILKDVEEIIKSMGEKEKFSLIVERGQILFGAPSVDITDKVVSLYNDSQKKKAPPKK
jgi:outer membrane protein